MNSKNYFTSIGFGALSLGANAKLVTFKNTINESASIAKIITESKEFKFEQHERHAPEERPASIYSPNGVNVYQINLNPNPFSKTVVHFATQATNFIYQHLVTEL